MAKNVDDLNRESDILKMEINDKAIVIRRLLEDNTNLNCSLSHAQG